MRAGGACVPGGCAWQGGACMVKAEGGVRGKGGGCVTGDTATAAGGTHPTGMHSCYYCCRLGDFVSEPSPFRVASSDDNLNLPLTVGYNSIYFISHFIFIAG